MTERDGFFTVRQAAWHGLGQVLEAHPTRGEAQKIAHDWEPVTEPVYRRVPKIVTLDDGSLDVQDGYEEVEQFKAVVRSDDGFTLSVQPDTYEVVRNSEMYDIAEAIEGGDPSQVRYETGGSLLGGRKVWLLLRLAEPLIIKGDPNGAVIPYYALQNNHDGGGAFRGQATMTRIVCHEKGTRILHDGEWINVEEHPSYVGSKVDTGYKVRIAGIPEAEVVTQDHRYWVAEATDSGGTMSWWETEWIGNRVNSRRKDRVVWIGYPIDTAEVAVDLLDNSDDLWWAVGYWWGNGHLAGTRQVCWTVSDPVDEARLMNWLRSLGFKGKGTQRQGCRQITAALPALYDFLVGFYRGEGRGKNGRQKVPTVSVQHLPGNALAQVVQGYWDADGYRDKRGGAQWSSSSYEGLLVLRQMLARLGRPCSIRRARKETSVRRVAGHWATVQPSWTLRESRNPHGILVENGWIWSSVESVEAVEEREFCPITTDDHTYLTAFGLSHNCDNTAKAADLDAQARGTEFVFRHTRNVADRIEEARTALAGWRVAVERYAERMALLIDMRIDVRQRDLFLEEFVPMPVANVISDRVRQNIVDARDTIGGILDGPTCEGVADTAYGLVQASIEYAEHYRRAHSRETRFKRAYLDRSVVAADAARLAARIAVGA